MLWTLSLVRQERDLKIKAWFILETKNNVLSVMAFKTNTTVPWKDIDPRRLTISSILFNINKTLGAACAVFDLLIYFDV